MNESIKKSKEWFAKNQSRILSEYFDFLRIPSVSSEANYAPDVARCAEWLVDQLHKIDYKVELWRPAKGHPIVFASNLQAGPSKPTLLIYNHYDVQPIDPINEWDSPPFEPVLLENQVYARGAQDNKGQCFYVLQALRSLYEEKTPLPVNIKWVIEGEEEIGSKGFLEILSERQKELKADYLAVVDLGIPSIHTPSLTIGLRGLISMELTVEGSLTDLHSGSHGGIAYNPNHALAKLLAEVRDAEGKITIPGFYDQVKDLNENDRKSIAFTFDEEKYKTNFGILPTGGEVQYPPYERNTIRPTLEVNGLWGGYTGSGMKTVIPARAHAKLSCRLVPDQDPIQIGKLVAEYFQKRAPKGIKVTVQVHKGGGPALRTSTSSKIVEIFSQSFEEVFEKKCEYILDGATIPVIPKLAATANADVVMLGVGLSTDQIHAPNEHFGLDRLEKGFLVIVQAIKKLKPNNFN